MQATASFENANNVSFERTAVERIRNTPVLRLLSQGYIAVWLKLRPEVNIDTIVRAKIWLKEIDLDRDHNKKSGLHLNWYKLYLFVSLCSERRLGRSSQFC